MINMKTPQIRKEVKEEWVQYMLNEFENRINPGSEVKLLSWDMGDATKEGENFSGDVAKLEAKGMVHCKGEQNEKEYHHILKFQAPEAFTQEFKRKLEMSENEMNMYSSVIPELNKFQADLSDNQFPINIPTYIYSKYNKKEQVLVMENMKVHDYGNRPKEEGLGFEDAKVTLEQLARLHGVSYAYDKKHDFLKKYPSYEGTKFSYMFGFGMDVVIDAVIEFLGQKKEHKDLLDKVKESKPHTVKLMSEGFNKRNTQVFCLNHGDPWTNNILIKQNGDANELKSVLVDWEGAHWNILSYDLNYFIGGSLTPDAMKRRDELLQHYHSHFMNVTSTLGFPIPEWGFEQCKEEFLAVSSWALCQNLAFAMVLSEAHKKFKLSDHKHKPGKFKKGMAKAIVPVMLKPWAMNVIMRGTWKKIYKSGLKEMKTNKNEPLTERFLACILEGEKNGMFDIPLTES